MKYVKEIADKWEELNTRDNPAVITKKLNILFQDIDHLYIIDSFVVSLCGKMSSELFYNSSTSMTERCNILSNFNNKDNILSTYISGTRLCRVLKTMYPKVHTRFIDGLNEISTTGEIIKGLPYEINLTGLYIHHLCKPNTNLLPEVQDTNYSMGTNIMSYYYRKEFLTLLWDSSYTKDMMFSSLILLKDLYYFFNRILEGILEPDEQDVEKYYKIFVDISSYDDLTSQIKQYNEAFKHVYSVAKHNSDKHYFKELKYLMEEGYIDLINEYDSSIVNHLKLIN